MSANQSGYQGFQTPQDTSGEFNAMSFIVRQILNKANTATLVRVVSCTNSGGVSPVGYVSVQPLVNQVDGLGNAVPHGTINNLPYLRVQGGTNAIIIDPQPNDIGIAIFADRDISTVKASKKASNPASGRRFDYADGLYVGGVLNGSPVQYLQFSASGIDVTSPTAVNINAPIANVTATTSAAVTAPVIDLGASGQALQELMNATALGVFNGHTHSDPQGGTTSAPNQTMGATSLTTTVKAG
ncbi:MAG: hypothetical protein B7X10_00580 [Burkholderiales bacterium 21-58-4]|nr:MAG: hypothetical protein B7X10_00580 [Burkholderiales bacterium 21-58-4]